MATKVKRKSRPHPFKIEDEISEVEVSPTPLAWFTLEILLYVVVLTLTLVLRLWHLGAYPLSNAEAEQSLTAWALYHGHWPEVDHYSPLLLSLNALTFLLFGASDASARLASVLLGSGLVLLPLTLRRQLGPWACLLTAALLAISPSAIFLSRTLNSEIAVATGALMLVAGFFNWTEVGQQRWLLLMASGAALLLTAGPVAYSVLVVFGLIVLVKFSTFKTFWAKGLSYSTTNHPPLRKAGIFLVVTAILLATTATFNISGFSVATTLFVDWLNHFGFQTRPEAGFNAVFLLTVYEPFLVMAGLTGIAYAILRKNLPGLLFTTWFVGLLLLDMIMGGRPNGNVILSLVPLTFLAAMALTELGQGIWQWGTWGNEGVLLASGLVMASLGYILLTGWLTGLCSPDDWTCQYGWLLPVTVLVLFFVVVIFFGVMSDARAALRGAALAGVGVGLLVTISIGWRLNYGPLRHLAYQPLAGIPASTELVNLTDTLTNQSAIRVGDTTLLDTTLVSLTNSALRWQLRDYRHLNQTNTLSEGTVTTAIITPVSYSEGLDLNQAYVGQDFSLDAIWSPVGLSPKLFIKWLIYRQADNQPQGHKAVLWLRLDES